MKRIMIVGFFGLLCTGIMGACAPQEAAKTEHPAPTLTWEQVNLGCRIMGEGSNAHVMCNHGHSFNFRTANLHERLRYLKSKGQDNVTDGDLMATGNHAKEMGLPDPLTPLMRAFLGERVRLRVISYGPEFHTFHIHGHIWLDQGTPKDNRSILPAEVYDAVEFYAGAGTQNTEKRSGTGDWMYHCHVETHVPSGMWGVFRVGEKEQLQSDLNAEGRFPYELPSAQGGENQTIDVWVVAVEAKLVIDYVFLNGKLDPLERTLRLYVPFADKASWEAATAETAQKIVEAKKETWQPWVLVLKQGTTARVHLKNLMKDVPVSLHPHGVAYDIKFDGSHSPGIVKPTDPPYTYVWKADTPGTWPMHDHSRTVENIARGLFSAIIVKSPAEEQRIARDYIIFFHDYDMDWLMGRTQPSGVSH